MYEPNKQEEALMAALTDLGFAVWWNGYEIQSNAINNVYVMLQTLTNKGWVKGK